MTDAASTKAGGRAGGLSGELICASTGIVERMMAETIAAGSETASAARSTHRISHSLA
jgi:hypothetical protein